MGEVIYVDHLTTVVLDNGVIKKTCESGDNDEISAMMVELFF